MIFLRFWMVFGRFWGGFGGSKIIDFLDCVFSFRALVAGAFGGVSIKEYERIPTNMREYARALKNTIKYERFRKNIAEYSKIRENTTK